MLVVIHLDAMRIRNIQSRTPGHVEAYVAGGIELSSFGAGRALPREKCVVPLFKFERLERFGYIRNRLSVDCRKVDYVRGCDQS